VVFEIQMILNNVFFILDNLAEGRVALHA